MIIYFIIFTAGFVLGIILLCCLYNISQKFFYFGNAWKKYGDRVIRVKVVGRFADKQHVLIQNEQGDETIEPIENIIFMLDKKIEINELAGGAYEV